MHAAAGGLGLLLCQIARQRGARVIGTVSTEEKAALAHDAGAHDTILYTRQDFVAEVLRITDGAKVHVVYDSVGATTFLKSMDCLATRGMLALFDCGKRSLDMRRSRLWRCLQLGLPPLRWGMRSGRRNQLWRDLHGLSQPATECVRHV